MAIKKLEKLVSKKKKGDGMPKMKLVNGEQIIDRSIVDIATINTKEYGAYTIEQRALADYRDGLKPVYRRLLWAMLNLSLHYNGPFKKSARTVGDTIGQYHPHGDVACYSAMVTMANSAEKLVDGQGNWGSHIDAAAAYRYTEARLSKYAEEYLLDHNYIAVTDMVQNFSGDKMEPVILPAKLPNLLLNGSEGIATGVSSYIPSFDRAGVVKLVKMALKGTTIKASHCLKYLEFKFPYGGECVSSEKELLAYFTTGSGSVYFRPSYTMSPDRITITSTAPRFNVENQLNKLAGINGVIRVNDETDKDGIKFVLYYKRGIDAKEKKDLHTKFLHQITTSVPFQTAVTERHADETVSFRRTNIPAILNDWTKWRIELEIKVINYLMKIEMEKLERLQLILKAVMNLKIVIASLESKDPMAYLVKYLSITTEQANFILDLKVRQLAKMESGKIKEQIEKCKAVIKTLKLDLKNPAERILKQL